MYHYTYRITNKKLNKHYYGTRTSKRKPEEDIGICYFSSSRDKWFIRDQKDNPQDYKYKVIKIFNTRKEAIEMEIKLHNKFNVGINESFFNKTKQTSTGFDRTGIVFNIDFKGKNNPFYNKKHSEKTKEKISKSKIGKKWSEERHNLFKKNYIKENHPNYGKKLKDSTKEKISKSNKDKIISEETKKKLSNAAKGNKNGFYGKNIP